MNISVQNTRSFASAVAGHEARGGYEALRQVVELYDNDDSFSREKAEEAFNEGRPAYWTMSSYSDAVSCLLVDAANMMHSLDAALDLHVKADKRIEQFLGRLVPLNEEAAQELSEAYAKHTGTWRDIPDLLTRRVRDCRRAA
jgi:hypothetical protein